MLARYDIAIVFNLPPGLTKWEGFVYDTQVKPLLPGICDALIKQKKTQLVVAGGKGFSGELCRKMEASFPGVSWNIYEGDAAIKKLLR